MLLVYVRRSVHSVGGVGSDRMADEPPPPLVSAVSCSSSGCHAMQAATTRSSSLNSPSSSSLHGSRMEDDEKDLSASDVPFPSASALSSSSSSSSSGRGTGETSSSSSNLGDGAVTTSRSSMAAARQRAAALCQEFVNPMEDDPAPSATSSTASSDVQFSTPWWLKLAHKQRANLITAYRGLLVNMFDVIIPARKKTSKGRFDKLDTARRDFIVNVALPRLDNGAFPAEQDDRALFMPHPNDEDAPALSTSDLSFLNGNQNKNMFVNIFLEITMPSLFCCTLFLDWAKTVHPDPRSNKDKSHTPQQQQSILKTAAATPEIFGRERLSWIAYLV